MSANRIVVDFTALCFICALNERVSYVLITLETIPFVVSQQKPQELKVKSQLLFYITNGNS